MKDMFKARKELKLQMENNIKLNEHNMDLKKRNAQLQIELIDLRGFYSQKEDLVNELKKERTQLRRQLTIAQNKLKEGK